MKGVKVLIQNFRKETYLTIGGYALLVLRSPRDGRRRMLYACPPNMVYGRRALCGYDFLTGSGV